MRLSHLLGISALACTLAAASAQAGTSTVSRSSSYSRPNTNLVITRAPNFGNHEHLKVFVDGRYLGMLGYGRRFEATVSAGAHIIAMQQVPHWNDAYPVSFQRIVVWPGRNNAYIARWIDGGSRIALEES